MQLILKENVDHLGTVGDIVTVKPGFGRNYLIPRGLAVFADKKNVKEFEHHKNQLDFKRQKLSKDAESLKAKIEAISLEFFKKAGEEGKLFGSITSMDIAAGVADKGVEIDRKRIQLSEPIKTLGAQQVAIKLDAGVVAQINVVVTAEAE